MNQTLNIPRTIGICGAATSGKDTLCQALIQIIGSTNARRFSIAGDKIREDLKQLVYLSLGWDITQLNPTQKEIIRPLMVEYGRLMRNNTEGRYFIDHLQNQEAFQFASVRIIPDIRYDEYRYDERYWVLEEQRGFLIYIERAGVPPANQPEQENLQRLKLQADHIVAWDTLNNIEQDSLVVAQQIVQQHFTTSPSDIAPLVA